MRSLPSSWSTIRDQDQPIHAPSHGLRPEHLNPEISWILSSCIHSISWVDEVSFWRVGEEYGTQFSSTNELYMGLLFFLICEVYLGLSEVYFLGVAKYWLLYRQFMRF